VDIMDAERTRHAGLILLRRWPLALAALALALALLPAGPLTRTAHAAPYAVTRTDDPAPDGCAIGDCSLREAIIAANGSGGLDLIFLPAGTYVLSIAGSDDAAAMGDLDITDTVSIYGVSPALGDGAADADERAAGWTRAGSTTWAR
jgi:CSLREA domain-containing protein